MLFAADPHDGFVQRAVIIGALVGVARRLKRTRLGELTSLLEVERYTEHAPGTAYTQLGFRPPSGSVATARPLVSIGR